VLAIKHFDLDQLETKVIWSKPVQVVAVMDTRDLAASIMKSQARIEQAQKAINEARASLDQQRSQVLLARQEMERTQTPV